MDYNLEAKDLKADGVLIDQLLPYCARNNRDWSQMTPDTLWTGTVAFKNMMEALKNQLRKNGIYLAEKIREARDLRDDTESVVLSQADGTPQ